MADPIYTQTHFRGYADDGDPGAATVKAAIDGDFSQNVDESFRLRFAIQESAAKAENNPLMGYEYRLYTDSWGGWIVCNTTSSVIRVVASSYMVDTASDPVQRVGSGTFTDGEEDDDAILFELADFVGNDELETESTFQIISGDVANGNLVEVRVTDPNLAVWNNTPQITVIKAGGEDRNIDEYEEVTVLEDISLVFGTVILNDPYEDVTVEEDTTVELGAQPDIEADEFDTVGTDEDVTVEVTTKPDLDIDEFESITVLEDTIAQFAHEFVLSLSPHFIDGAATTVQLLAPNGKDTGDFQAGKIHESSNPADAIDLDADLYTEIEFCFKATIDAGEVSYDFRIEGLDTYAVTPQLTIIAAGETLSVNVHDCAETEVCLV